MKKDSPRYALIGYRLHAANEVLADARNLLETQGSTRSIVNRAYYAMFYATMALLASYRQGYS